MARRVRSFRRWQQQHNAATTERCRADWHRLAQGVPWHG
jgi:hypothetical protein